MTLDQAIRAAVEEIVREWKLAPRSGWNREGDMQAMSGVIRRHLDPVVEESERKAQQYESWWRETDRILKTLHGKPRPCLKCGYIPKILRLQGKEQP